MSKVAPSTTDPTNEIDNAGAAAEVVNLPDEWECVENDERKGLLYVRDADSERWQSISLKPYGDDDLTIIANHRKAPYDATRVGRDPVTRKTLDSWTAATEWIAEQIEGEQ